MLRPTSNKKISGLAAVIVSLLSLTGCADSTSHGKFTQPLATEAKMRQSEMKVAAILEKAQQRFVGGSLMEARQLVDDALALNPQSAGAWLLKTQIYLEIDENESAFNEVLAKGLQIAPDDARFYYYEGLFYDRRGNTAKAETAYRNAAQRDDDTVQYKLAAAEMLIEQQRFADAEHYLQNARRRHPNAAGIAQELGHLAQIRGDTALAVNYFQEAALLSPNEPQLQNDLAIAYFHSDNYEKALGIFEKLPTTSKETQLLQAVAYLKTNQPVKARKMLNELLRDPGNVSYDLWTKMAETALLLNDESLLRKSAEKMLRLAPQKEDGYLALSRFYEMRGNKSQALTELERCPAAARSSLFNAYRSALING